jgi:hypothetical protein
MDIRQGERLPDEIRASVRKQGINRLLTQEMMTMIVDKISMPLGRSLGEIEVRALITHIKKLDGNKFLSLSPEEASTQIANGFMRFSNKSDHAIYDVHEIMKQYIGGGVKAEPDRFLLSKNCGDIGATPNTVDSVRRPTAYRNPYGLFPRLDEPQGYPLQQQATEGLENGDPKSRASVEAQSQGLLRDSQAMNDQDSVGMPIIGDYLRKGKTIEPRERSIRMLLDSRYRNRSTSLDVYSWNISFSPNEENGSVSIQQAVNNIITIQFDEFHIPYVPSADTPYRKISLLIDEFQFSSVIAHEFRHYHMLFNSTIETNRIRLTPSTQDKGKYNFTVPINWINRITISFGNPLTPINFLPEFYVVYLTVNGVNSTYLNFTDNHQVSDGETIYLSNFTTANPSTDFATIKNINDPLGHQVAFVSNTVLEITTDLSTIVMVSPPQKLECYIATRRIFIPLRFVFLQ